MTTSNNPGRSERTSNGARAALSDDVDDLAESVKAKAWHSARRRDQGGRRQRQGASDEHSDDDDYSGSAVGTVSDKASSAKGAVADKAYAAKEHGKRKSKHPRHARPVRQAPRRMRRRAQGNPLAAGVIAFGLGMLVSSLIPSTEKEREAVSQLQENLEQVKEKASEVAQDMAENLKQPAQESSRVGKGSRAAEGIQVTSSKKVNRQPPTSGTKRRPPKDQVQQQSS